MFGTFGAHHNRPSSFELINEWIQSHVEGLTFSKLNPENIHCFIRIRRLLTSNCYSVAILTVREWCLTQDGLANEASARNLISE